MYDLPSTFDYTFDLRLIVKMGKYDDIINLPHHISKEHPQMSMYMRAAQFAPFAALTGHDSAIQETARITESQVELEEEAKKILDKKLGLIREHINEHPQITITYFVPDKRKTGGSYRSYSGRLRDIDESEQKLIMTDDNEIYLSSISEIDSELYDNTQIP